LWEAPDNVSMAAVTLAISGGGALSSFETTVLLSIDETMDALRKAGQVQFRAPRRAAVQVTGSDDHKPQLGAIPGPSEAARHCPMTTNDDHQEHEHIVPASKIPSSTRSPARPGVCTVSGSVP
jgi:hypothetical protein